MTTITLRGKSQIILSRSESSQFLPLSLSFSLWVLPRRCFSLRLFLSSYKCIPSLTFLFSAPSLSLYWRIIYFPVPSRQTDWCENSLSCLFHRSQPADLRLFQHRKTAELRGNHPLNRFEFRTIATA